MADDNYTSPDFIGPQLDNNIAQLTALLEDSGLSPKARDNLQSELGDNQNKRKQLMGPSAPPADPKDIAGVLDNPGVPKDVKRNALAAGYATPGVREEYARRLGGAAEAANQEKAALRQETDMLAAIFSNQKQTAEQKAQNDANILRERQLQGTMTAAENTANLSRRGINLSDVNSLVATSAVDQLDRYHQMMALDKEIKKDQAVSFLDNPLDWLFAQMNVGPKIDQHNAIASQYNKTEEYINSASKTAALVRDANVGKLAAMTNTEAELLARNKILEGQKALGQLDEEQVKLGEKYRKEGKAIDDRVTNQLGLAIDRADKDEDRDARAAEAKLRNEAIIEGKKYQRTLAEEAADRKRTEAERKEKAAEEQADRDDLVAKALGKYNITTEKQFNKLPPKEKERMTQLLKSYDETKGYGNYGATPVDVLTNVGPIKAKSGELNEGQQILVKSMLQLQEKGKLASAAMGKEQGLENVNTIIKKDVTKWMANPTVMGPPDGEGGNVKLFNTPPLVEMAKQPSLGGNKAAMKVSELAAANPNAEITHQMLVTALASDLKGKDDISTVAKQLSDFYKTGVAAVNKNLQLDRFAVPPMQSFNVPLPTGYFGGKTNYDVASVKGATVALARTQIDLSKDPDIIMSMSKIAESGGK